MDVLYSELYAALYILNIDFNIFPLWRGLTGSWGYWELTVNGKKVSYTDQQLVAYTLELINNQ